MINVYNFKIISGEHYGKSMKLLHELYNYVAAGKNPDALKEPARIEIYAYNEELLRDMLYYLYNALTSTVGISASLLDTSEKCTKALKRLPCMQRGLKVGYHRNDKDYLIRMLKDSEGVVFVDDVHEEMLGDILVNKYPENLEVVIGVAIKETPVAVNFK